MPRLLLLLLLLILFGIIITLSFLSLSLFLIKSLMSDASSSLYSGELLKDALLLQIPHARVDPEIDHHRSHQLRKEG